MFDDPTAVLADGSFTMVLARPGTYVFQVVTPLTRQPLPTRMIEILDAPYQEVELAFGETALTGVVLDADSLAPVEGASVSAVREGATTGPRAMTVGRDGRFAIAVDSGVHVVTARAEGRASASQPVSVAENATADVELRLGPGGVITGRVVDDQGRGVPGVRLSALPEQQKTPGDRTLSGPNGEFHLHRLSAEPHVLFARTEDGLFALRAGVKPGQDDIQVRLQPGAAVTLRLHDTEGHPIRSAAVRSPASAACRFRA